MPKKKESRQNELLKLIADIPVWFTMLCISSIFWMVLLIGFSGHYLFPIAEKTGPIGDTLGGLTAPFIGILNAVLVYQAFRQQLAANNLQRQAIAKEQERYESQRDFEILLKLFEKIESEVKTITFTSTNKNDQKILHYGAKAVEAAMYYELVELLKPAYNEISEKSRDYLFNVDPATGKFSWKEYNNRFSISNACASDSELQMELKTYHLFFPDTLVTMYLTVLSLVYSWVNRLDKSKMPQSDKITLAQGFMSFLVNTYFNLSSFDWLYNAIRNDDESFIGVVRMEYRINTVLNTYKDTIESNK